jgi:chromatin segregation and condensation protein Rec8/ScpA/Scc1 (kleisin family)
LSAHEGPLLFTDLLERKWWRLEWIVTFLAMLELARQTRIVILQEEPLGDLWLAACPEGAGSNGAMAGEHPQGE